MPDQAMQAAPVLRPTGHAPDPEARLGLGQALHQVLDRLGAPAGAALLREGLDAFAVRVATARAAQHRLDLQYYMWHGDVTGRLLAGEVLDAADRGVRVRLLLDDAYALGRERVLSALDSHPGIEVRLFNGTRWRMFGRAGFLLEMLFGGWHLNRRMHNKAWIADAGVAIAGGRNLGDAYFGAEAEEFNFRDMDLVLAGAAAEGHRKVFERYWASSLARPAAEVCQTEGRHRGLARLRGTLAEAQAAPEAQRYLAHLGQLRSAVSHLLRGMVAVQPGMVEVVADPPQKAKKGLAARRLARAAGGIAPEIADALRRAQREALLISPYFVPGQAGLALLLEMVARGVKVSVVTNSLAATDVVAVHGGYAKYREPLLRAGVSLFELKPSGEDEDTSVFGSRGASLHTKAFVVDDGPIFVGSFNLDPRSAALNTEMGAFVHHPTLAQELREEHARLAHPARSWRLGLEAGRLTWTGQGGDRGAVTLREEPDASLRRRAMATVLRWLPIESQL
ncbi:phospholipase D family protein [Falsiroseomonas selenitidurans]|uniref:Phospholipase D n=1 Tax=Falsiroseomonas selenitidurans TaxID=2716335 RepID=A0ABX1E0E0_9PROT|nr:phospholipase D family protein [Falsiroseomonas selenitidurans]NKC30531.1 phospholipase D family protein [Falsiroseomonas selenitidurans]